MMKTRVMFASAMAACLLEMTQAAVNLTNNETESPQIDSAVAPAANLSTATATFTYLEVLTRFTQYCAKYDKHYPEASEFQMRLANYREELVRVTEENAKGLPYFLRLNKYSDWTEEEKEKLSGSTRDKPNSEEFEVFKKEHQNEEEPQRGRGLSSYSPIDWRRRGHVTSIKSQGRCGSCSMFATTALIESHASIKTGGRHLDLSEQQLVSCSRKEGNEGCNGGWNEWNLRYLWRHRTKFMQEQDYPYLADNSHWRHHNALEMCQDSKASSVGAVTVNDYKMFDDVSKDDIKYHLQFGPVGAYVGVASNWSSYGGGIADERFFGQCSRKDSYYNGHAILIVGWDELPFGEQYWIIKNSHGEDWGDNGFMYLHMDANDQPGGLKGTCAIREQIQVLNPDWIDVHV